MVCILSYCNTTRKKKQLSSLVQSVKINHPDQKILVYSHYGNVEPEFYSGADYYIFDHSNPKSPKSFCDWILVHHQGKKFYRWGSDWGFAVLQMTKRASLFMKSIGDEGCFFLNYDADPSALSENRILEESKNLSLDQIGVFSHWGKATAQFNLTCFYLDLPKIQEDFFREITAERYNSFSTSIIPEEIFRIIIDEDFKDRYVISKAVPSTFSESSRHLPPESSLNRFFGTLLPTRNNLADDKRKCLGAWNCTERIESMTVIIEGTMYLLFNEIAGDNGNVSFFSHLPDLVLVESITVLKINSETIEPSYSIEGLDDLYWQSNYHEFI